MLNDGDYMPISFSGISLHSMERSRGPDIISHRRPGEYNDAGRNVGWLARSVSCESPALQMSFSWLVFGSDHGFCPFLPRLVSLLWHISTDRLSCPLHSFNGGTITVKKLLEPQ